MIQSNISAFCWTISLYEKCIRYTLTCSLYSHHAHNHFGLFFIFSNAAYSDFVCMNAVPFIYYFLALSFLVLSIWYCIFPFLSFHFLFVLHFLYSVNTSFMFISEMENLQWIRLHIMIGKCVRLYSFCMHHNHWEMILPFLNYFRMYFVYILRCMIWCLTSCVLRSITCVSCCVCVCLGMHALSENIFLPLPTAIKQTIHHKMQWDNVVGVLSCCVFVCCKVGQLSRWNTNIVQF